MERKIEVNIGAFGSPAFVLFVVFMVLKLCGKIGWSWFYVTMPIWGFMALWITFFVAIFSFIALMAGVKWLSSFLS